MFDTYVQIIFYEQIMLQYFRLSCMYWPHSVPQAKPSFLPSPTAVPNYGENPAFSSPMMAANNMTNEHHMLGK
jgi:hypothetical protein